MGLYRLLYEFDVQPFLLHLVQQTYCLLGLPALICVDADTGIVADRLAYRSQSRHIQFRMGAHLDFQRVIAPADSIHRIPGHFIRIVYADGDIGDDLFAAAAQQLVDRNLVKLSVQIPESHVHGCLRAGISYDTFVQSQHQIFKIIHIPAHYRFDNVILESSQNRSGGVACDGSGGRRFSIAYRSRIGMYFYHNVLYA